MSVGSLPSPRGDSRATRVPERSAKRHALCPASPDRCLSDGQRHFAPRESEAQRRTNRRRTSRAVSDQTTACADRGISGFVGHRLDTPVLDLFGRGFAERFELYDALVAKVENDALRRAANHDGGGLIMPGYVTVETFLEIGHCDVVYLRQRCEMAHVAICIGGIDRKST